MAAKKAKNAVNGRARKKSAKSPAVRGGAKSGAKRTRRATGTTKAKPRRAVKSPRVASGTEVVSPIARRKPAKKAEPRPQRPPAVLPIPQSTFFF